MVLQWSRLRIKILFLISTFKLEKIFKNIKTKNKIKRSKV